MRLRARSRMPTRKIIIMYGQMDCGCGRDVNQVEREVMERLVVGKHAYFVLHHHIAGRTNAVGVCSLVYEHG